MAVYGEIVRKTGQHGAKLQEIMKELISNPCPHLIPDDIRGRLELVTGFTVSGSERELEHLISAIKAKRQPVASFTLYQSQMTAVTKWREARVLKESDLPAKKTTEKLQSHAVAFSGVLEPQLAFKLINSWGKEWGDEGEMLIQSATIFNQVPGHPLRFYDIRLKCENTPAGPPSRAPPRAPPRVPPPLPATQTKQTVNPWQAAQRLRARFLSEIPKLEASFKSILKTEIGDTVVFTSDSAQSRELRTKIVTLVQEAIKTHTQSLEVKHMITLTWIEAATPNMRTNPLMLGLKAITVMHVGVHMSAVLNVVLEEPLKLQTNHDLDSGDARPAKRQCTRPWDITPVLPTLEIKLEAMLKEEIGSMLFDTDGIAGKPVREKILDRCIELSKASVAASNVEYNYSMLLLWMPGTRFYSKTWSNDVPTTDGVVVAHHSSEGLCATLEVVIMTTARAPPRQDQPHLKQPPLQGPQQECSIL
eukprot:c7372_g1_i1.p1 GENE.c7372_g1_i1~~c7372_g1_i1.p1  ORF type:complete len:538 (+),score=127.11 c7372_g1_i1:187-1614(+)